PGGVAVCSRRDVRAGDRLPAAGADGTAPGRGREQMNGRRPALWEVPIRPGSQKVLDVAGPRAPGQASSLREGKILYLENLTVSFDGFKALDALTFYMDPGELRCVIGPNGAGKTTMMDVITGKTRPDQGSAWFGRRIAP